MFLNYIYPRGFSLTESANCSDLSVDIVHFCDTVQRFENTSIAISQSPWVYVDIIHDAISDGLLEYDGTLECVISELNEVDE